MALNKQWTPEDFDKLFVNLQTMRDYEKYAVNSFEPMSDCAHMRCPSCKGSGIKSNGQICVHALSCSCSNCRTYS